jgi:lysophospholipase L1-like esterase
MRRRPLAALIGLALGLGLAEGGARVLEARRPAPAPTAPLTFRPHALLNFELTPDVRRRGRETIGPLGFRGLTPAVPKPAGTLRVLCLGGSTTYGDGLADGETYPERLQDLLAADGGVPCEVVNLGVPGYTTAETLMNLWLKGLDLEPDALVVYHAVNDYRPRTLPRIDEAYRDFRRVWVEEELAPTPLVRALGRCALGRMALGHRTRRHGLYAFTERAAPLRLSRAEIAAADSLFVFERNLRALVDVAGARGIGVVLATQAQCGARLQDGERAPIDEHNEVTRRVARERGALLCEVARDFPEQDTFLPGDPVHLSAAGSREQAQRIARTLRESGVLRRAPLHAPAPVAEDWIALEALPSPLSPHEREALGDAALLRPAPYFAYDPAPAAVGPGTLGPHDADGFRGVSAAGAAARCVAVVGGAAAYGLGVVEAESTPRALADLLAREGAPARVVNAGVPGHTSAEGLARLHFAVLPRARPDVLVIAHDVEDALAFAAPGFRGDYGHLRKTFRDREPGVLGGLLERPGRAGLDPLGCGAPLRSLRPALPPYAALGLARAPGAWALERNLRTMVDLARAGGCRVVLLQAAGGDAPPGVHQALTAWNSAVARVAAATGATVADAAAGSDPRLHFLAGGWLPSAAGHRHRAAVLAAALR